MPLLAASIAAYSNLRVESEVQYWTVAGGGGGGAGLNAGQVAGIAIGVSVAMMLLAGVAGYVVLRRWRTSRLRAARIALVDSPFPAPPFAPGTAATHPPRILNPFKE